VIRQVLPWCGLLVGAAGFGWGIYSLVRDFRSGSIKLSWYGDIYDRELDASLFWLGISGKMVVLIVSAIVQYRCLMKVMGS
jgi:hypothetical protein